MAYSDEQIDAAIQASLKVIGVERLKASQIQAVVEFVKGRDVLVCLPTGYGKSLCFALLPLVFDHLRRMRGSIVVCISPLTSLMMDQKAKFSHRGLIVEFVGELQHDIENIRNVREGKVQLLYVSPESILRNPQWRDMLMSDIYKVNMVAVAVDEAHCIAKWGESFRGEYSKLGELRSIIPKKVSFMALTATASRSTREVIFRSLGMWQPVIVYISPQKKNMMYSVRKKESIEKLVEEISAALSILGKYMPRMIIFCKQYDECSTMYRLFKHFLGPQFTIPPCAPDLSKFRVVDMYTRCTEISVKEGILTSFGAMDGNLRVVIGTIAFGMGIDCPDVRQIIHWDPSADVESYIQETGRAGRDEYLSRAVLFHSASDYRFSSSSMVNYCMCRRNTLFKDFDEKKIITPCTGCLCCDICMSRCSCTMCSESKFPVNNAFLC